MIPMNRNRHTATRASAKEIMSHYFTQIHVSRAVEFEPAFPVCAPLVPTRKTVVEKEGKDMVDCVIGFHFYLRNFDTNGDVSPCRM